MHARKLAGIIGIVIFVALTVAGALVQTAPPGTDGSAPQPVAAPPPLSAESSPARDNALAPAHSDPTVPAPAPTPVRAATLETAGVTHTPSGLNLPLLAAAAAALALVILASRAATAPAASVPCIEVQT